MYNLNLDSEFVVVEKRMCPEVCLCGVGVPLRWSVMEGEYSESEVKGGMRKKDFEFAQKSLLRGWTP